MRRIVIAAVVAGGLLMMGTALAQKGGTAPPPTAGPPVPKSTGTGTGTAPQNPPPPGAAEHPLNGTTTDAANFGVIGYNYTTGYLGRIGGRWSGVEGRTPNNASAGPGGTGVLGVAPTPNATAMKAVGSGAGGTALHVEQGAIRVGPQGPAFVVSASPNVVPRATFYNGGVGRPEFMRCTTSASIDHPMVNGDADAMIQVTARNSPMSATQSTIATSVTYFPTPIANGGGWTIQATSELGTVRGTVAENTQRCVEESRRWTFNVVVIKK
jgi:hypothetical protein